MQAISRIYRTDIAASPDRLMAWHASPAAFERLSPPWRKVDVVASRGTVQPGDRKTIRVGLVGPLGVTWTLEHRALDGVTGFADVQVAGPFRAWRHEHRFLPRAGGSILEDRITWELPRSTSFAAGRVESELDRLFALRHARTRADLDRLAGAGHDRPLRVAITGSTGLVGTRLTAFLRAGGHEVLRLVRGPASSPDEVHWDPMTGDIDAAALEGLDAVVHLAGASIAGGLWTRTRKAAIRDSRVLGTHLLAKTLAEIERPPAVLVSTSAVGYYGSRGDTVLTESADPGEGFLAGVVEEWEAAAAPAARAGIRVVHPRFGLVLAGEGGLLPLISIPFRMGFGGPLGSGRQYMSWIALDDLVGIIFATIVNPALSGPVNAVAPNPVTNAEFTRALASALHRPAVFRVPAPAMRLVAGQLAEELILVSQRVVPAALEAEGFAFAFPTIDRALRHELGKSRADPVPSPS